MRRLLTAAAFLLAACTIAAPPAKAPTNAPASQASAPQSTAAQLMIDPSRLPKSCGKLRVCGTLGYVDCGSATDGPALYFERASGKVVGRCGGFCRGDMQRCARDCPPPEWSCR